MRDANEIRACFNQILECSISLQDELSNMIKAQASPNGDMRLVRRYAKCVETLKAGQRSLKVVKDDIIEILDSAFGRFPDFAEIGADGLRHLVVEVSQGMINQSLLTLSDARKQGRVSIGEIFRIELPDGSAFETELINPGSKLRERSMIRRFYDLERITPGDEIALKEKAPGHWVLLSRNTMEGEEAILHAHGLNIGDIKLLLADQEEKRAELEAAKKSKETSNR